MPRSNTPAVAEVAKAYLTAFRCPPDLLELAKIKAKQTRRSLSNYVVYLIAKDLEGMELPADQSK